MIAKEVDNGFTPKSTSCVMQLCRGKMWAWDEVKIPPSQAHAYEWYRVTTAEFHELSREQATHVREGGLFLRKRSHRATSASRDIVRRATAISLEAARAQLRKVTGGKEHEG